MKMNRRRYPPLFFSTRWLAKLVGFEEKYSSEMIENLRWSPPRKTLLLLRVNSSIPYGNYEDPSRKNHAHPTRKFDRVLGF
jgi:hypothetical protein